MIRLEAMLRNGLTIDLAQPEFIGDKITNISEAREAAECAIDYIGRTRVKAIKIIMDEQLIEVVK